MFKIFLSFLLAAVSCVFLTACATLSNEVQADSLQQQLQYTGAQVIPESQHIKIVLPSSMGFANNSTILSHRAYPSLNNIVSFLKTHPNMQIKIAGFTDNVGSARSNVIVSEERAKRIANYLMDHGIRPDRIQTQGLGEKDPIASNHTLAGRAKNRRVEMYLFQAQ